VFTRAQHSLELIATFDTIFATKTRAEWAEIFDRHDLVWGPVQSIAEVVNDPQARALEAFVKVPHRTGQDIEVVRTPIEFSATPARIRHAAPELGEHTEEVLLEHGYTWDDIAALKEKGAIG
jgi:crotonobetainyl-CoA:carnitine CoA-transferase CaiB-like acyl-CoA transferase